MHLSFDAIHIVGYVGAVGSLLFGAVGFVAFMYGKQMALWKPMVFGGALMVYPYFVPQTWLIYAIGCALCLGLALSLGIPVAQPFALDVRPLRETMATYFTKDFFGFLKELEKNNNREWFTKHKARYEQDVQEPSVRFIRDAAVRLKTESVWPAARIHYRQHRNQCFQPIASLQLALFHTGSALKSFMVFLNPPSGPIAPDDPLPFQPPNGCAPGHAPVVAPPFRFA